MTQTRFKLRDYQQAASDAAITFLKKRKGNGILVEPTGCGKSLIIADIAHRIGEPVLVFQPSKEILEQNYAKMLTYTTDGVGVFSASMSRKEIAPITFCTIGSVHGRHEEFKGFRYAIIDECHGVNPSGGMYMNFIKATGMRVIGLTATPYRLYTQLGMDGYTTESVLRFITRTRPRIFSEVLHVTQVAELLERGYLANLEYYPIRGCFDRTRLKVNSTGADFTDKSVKEAYQASMFDNQLLGYVERMMAKNRNGILVFTKFVEEAEYLVGALGERATIVSGATPKRQREEILERFKAGDIKVVANVGVLTTGFDYPALDTVVIARPTMSLALYYQMVGRAIRPYEGKQAWIVDLCGNIERFGHVDRFVVEKDSEGHWMVRNDRRQLTNKIIRQ